MAKTQERAQAKAERDVVNEAKAKVKADKPAPNASNEPKANGHDKSKTLDDYPEAPWAYETPKVAAQMAHDYANEQGHRHHETLKATSVAHHAKRIEATRDVFADISKEVSEDQIFRTLRRRMNKMLSVRNESDAKNFRDAI
jgi:hypothetical protein